MHVDEFIASNEAGWARLRELTRRAGRRAGRLSGAELDELVHGYQRTSTHLSLARSRYRDPALTLELTRLVARAGALVYGTRPRTLRGLTRFATDTFPAALWHLRWFVLASTLVFAVPFVAVGLWVGLSDAALEAAGPEAVREAYVSEEFEEYYTATPTCMPLKARTTTVGTHASTPSANAMTPTRMLFVVTSAVNSAEGSAETLLTALPLVVRSHLVVVTAVRDPSVEHWVQTSPAEASAAYRKAAAAASGINSVSTTSSARRRNRARVSVNARR